MIVYRRNGEARTVVMLAAVRENRSRRIACWSRPRTGWGCKFSGYLDKKEKDTRLAFPCGIE